MSRPQAGDRINNYLLDEQIAAGSFGEVWKAHHHVFNEPVAIKIPTDPQYVRHLQREGMAIHGLHHPNIVRALDLDPYADPPYLVMEYVDGPSLLELIVENPGGLPIEAAVAILAGTLSALAAAHKAGVIHRDIKPANILIVSNDDDGTAGAELTGITPARVKVTDFGLGRLQGATAAAMVQSGSISTDASRRTAGTLVYMSPEQRDGRDVDARSDLYSAGVVLHEMLTGVLPQGTDLPSSIRRDVPRWLDDLFERSYTRRDHRFESARQMQEVMERYQSPGLEMAPAGAREEGRIGRAGADTARRCTGCHGVVNADDQFCIHCGRRLVEDVPRCPSCHGFVGREDKFCILCGIDLREGV